MVDAQELDSIDWHFDEARIRSKGYFNPAWEELDLREPIFLWAAILLSVGVSSRPQRAVTKEHVERMRAFAYTAANGEALDRLSEALHRGETFSKLRKFGTAPRTVQWQSGDQESELVLPMEFFSWADNQGWPIPSSLQAMLHRHVPAKERRVQHTPHGCTTIRPPQETPETVQTSQTWGIKQILRSDTLRSMLHPILSEMNRAGEPIPNPRKVMLALEASAHPDFIFQDGSELKYLDAAGVRKAINADSLRKRIERMIVVIQSGEQSDKAQ